MENDALIAPSTEAPPVEMEVDNPPPKKSKRKGIPKKTNAKKSKLIGFRKNKNKDATSEIKSRLLAKSLGRKPTEDGNLQYKKDKIRARISGVGKQNLFLSKAKKRLKEKATKSKKNQPPPEAGPLEQADLNFIPKTSAHGHTRKMRRLKPGVQALKQIHKYQRSTDKLLPRLSFARVVREIAQDINPEIQRFEKGALDALQEAAEAYVTEVMDCSNICAIHAKRVTITPRDLSLCTRITKNYNLGVGLKNK